jgi:RND family efflux transporter MFP subunit
VALLLGLLLSAQAATGREALPVTVQALASLSVYPRREAPATVLSLNESVVAAEVAGRLVRFPVRVGDLVTRDAPLAFIDCRDYELERQRVEAVLRGVEARLEFAQYQLRQAETLSQKRNVSEETLAQRRSEVAALQAQKAEQTVVLAVAGRNRDKCTVRAPFRALVGARLSAEGEWRNPGEPVARLVDLDDLEVSAQVPLDDVGELAGAGLSFSDGRRSYPLSLRAVLAAVATRARTREARLAFAAEPALPGSPGRLVWQARLPHLPPELLVRRGDALGVFLAQDGHARFRAVPGALEGQPAPTDLPPDSRLIVDGRFGLRDGDPVTVVP